MPDVYDRGLPGSVQIFSAVSGGNPAAFARDGERIGLLEIARKQSSIIRHGVRILAEQRKTLQSTGSNRSRLRCSMIVSSPPMTYCLK